jgi:glycosyltransferase involved in cell wall biosynthesis
MQGSSTFVTVVVPVYRNQGTVGPLSQRIKDIMDSLPLDWELLLVMDGESDAALHAYVGELPEKLPVTIARLSRNFGQHAALRYGIAEAKSGPVVVMDADLQDPPEMLPAVLEPIVNGGVDIVFTSRSGEYDEVHRRVARRSYQVVFESLTGLTHDPSHGPVFALSEKARRYLSMFAEDAHTLHLLKWLDLPSVVVPYDRQPRLVGSSSYSLRHRLKHARRGIMFSSSRIMGGLFAVSAAAAVVAVLVLGVIAFLAFQGNPPSGWLSLVAVVVLGFALNWLLLAFVGSLLLEVLGIVRARPAVVVDRKWVQRGDR